MSTPVGGVLSGHAVLDSTQAVLVNITEQHWVITRTYGVYQVPGKPVDEEYATLRFKCAAGSIDLGDRRSVEYPILARDIANDIAREINSDSGDGSFHGVFLCAGNGPTREELDAAHARLREFDVKLVAAADLEWDRSRNPMFITDLERRAARRLKVDKEWLYDQKPMAECPACAERIKPGVAVCRACGAILDPAKAAQFGLVDQRPARPPAEEGSEKHTRRGK